MFQISFSFFPATSKDIPVTYFFKSVKSATLSLIAHITFAKKIL